MSRPRAYPAEDERALARAPRACVHLANCVVQAHLRCCAVVLAAAPPPSPAAKAPGAGCAAVAACSGIGTLGRSQGGSKTQICHDSENLVRRPGLSRPCRMVLDSVLRWPSFLPVLRKCTVCGRQCGTYVRGILLGLYTLTNFMQRSRERFSSEKYIARDAQNSQKRWHAFS